MDKSINLNMVNESNILVREEQSAISKANLIEMPGFIKPGISTPFRSAIITNIIPLLKALVIITLFLLDGVGFSPLGCKTQYLFSSRFWFNKQIVIFFIIYFIINLGGENISKLTNPIQQLIISIACVILYNILAKLGEIWWNPNPWYWPGPMTWFGLIALPLVILYIFEDMRRFYMAENAVVVNSATLDNLKKAEIGVIILITTVIIIGFFKAMNLSIKKHGKYFSFLAFLFGVPMGEKKTGKIELCNEKKFRQISKEINLARAKNYHSNANVISTMWKLGSVSVVALVVGYLTMFKAYPLKIWKIFKNELRNQKMGSGGIN